ncbi:MAG TPA: DNA-binding protein [Alphaproteobacteria bacterium]|nr:DNA-binding protein [Alphaproteobacteria bacterium]HIB56728.1 DNA-binding protein [Alphaproteobacteria bacterium]HIO00493.1 DNA-binding protein [Alphaproteobacteria bacterium]
MVLTDQRPLLIWKKENNLLYQYNPKSYSVSQVSKLIRRSPSVVYRMIKSGDLYSHGRPVRVSHQALQDWALKRLPAIPRLFGRG